MIFFVVVPVGSQRESDVFSIQKFTTERGSILMIINIKTIYIYHYIDI